MKLNEFLAENGDREIVDIEALEKCLEPKKPKTIWDIEEDDRYFIFYSDGSIKEDIWQNWATDIGRRSMGFAFLTGEEAETRKKMLQIEEELIKHGGRRELKAGKANHYICYRFMGNELSFGVNQRFILNEIYFDTQEQAKKAVEAIGHERIIDEYFKPRLIEEQTNG